jgi:hypothetical protein
VANETDDLNGALGKNDRDYFSYQRDLNNKVVKRVKVSDVVDANINNSILSGVIFDSVQITYPNVTTELYKYFSETVLTATVTVTYVAANKREIQSVTKI